MSALAQITDMVTRAKARLLAQYASLPRFSGMVGALVAEAQAAEAAIFGLLAQLDLSSATGIWLDRLAWVVGEEREGASDAQLRAYAQARVLANKSQGTVEEVYAVAETAYPSATYAETELPPNMQMVCSGAMTDAVATRLARLMGRARPTGVRLSMLYSTLADASTFTFATGSSPEASSAQGWGDTGNPNTGGGFASALNA